MKQLRELDDRQKTLPCGEPFDEKYRRLRYCRYADDFILGVIGSKDEAREIMQLVENFIADTLKLQVSPEKTGICSGEEGITFLSYRISTDRSDKIIRTKRHGRYIRQRTINDNIRLDIPSGKAQEFCQRYGYGNWDEMKPTHRCKLSPLSDEEIICVYNAELRGLANYYCLAKGMKHYLNRLEFMFRYSLFKTFAYKYKTTVSKAVAKFRKGNEFIRDYEIKGKRYQMKVFKLAHTDSRPKDWNMDEIPNTLQFYALRSELIKRLNYKVCEYCGNTEPPFESHHVRKVKDLSKKKHLARWEWLMVTRNRKTLVLCRKCHKDLHAGKLPDSRYQGNT
jgi:RNA-directed DNA polymerase